ncbi:MAG: MDR family MFS transporter [Mycobacterium leprae]
MNKRTKYLLTTGIMIGLLVSALDTTIVDTAFPRMVAELHGEAIFTWVLTMYMLTSTAVVPMVGKLADMYGRRLFFLAGVALFVSGSVLCGLAGSMMQLIIFRGLQGIGGGMLLPAAYTIVGDIYPGAQRVTAQAFLSAVWGIAASVGPKLGGWLTQYYTWRWIFFINLPIGLIAIAIIFFGYKESGQRARQSVDWLGSMTITASTTFFLLALARGGVAWAWGGWQSLGLFGAAAAFLLLSVWVESRVPEPVLDPKLFRNRIFTVVNAGGLIAGAAMYGAIVFIPWFMQGINGVDPNQAGNVAMPMMLALGICTVLAGRLALKVPYRVLFSTGFVLLSVGFYLMTGWNVNTTLLQATLCSMAVGAGLGLIIPMLTPTLQNAFPASQRGVVTSASQFSRQIGSTIGLTLFGVVFNQQMARGLQQQLAGAMPDGVARVFRQAVGDPQSLVRILLAKELQAALPAGVREQVVDGVKGMMAGSLQMVFWTGLLFVLVGLVATQFMGNAGLKQRAVVDDEQVALAVGD